MSVLINGISTDQVSVYDRGLMYGQGLFETIAVSNGNPCLLDAHLSRIQRDSSRLGISTDFDLLRDEILQLANEQELAVIRASLTMGEGGRGYLNPDSPSATRIVSRHQYPEFNADNPKTGIEIGVATIRLAHQPELAGIKHANRLEQIIARGQWQKGWQEALVLDQQENVIEATQSNVFIVRQGELFTPQLDLAGVAGVMRAHVLEQAKIIGVKASLVSLSVSDVEAADAVFLSNSLNGVWPVNKLNNQRFTDFSLCHKIQELMLENGAIPNT